MIPVLQWCDHEGREQSLPVTDRVFIGRTCAGVPNGKRITLIDKNVSRDHAVITFSGHCFTVRDTSRNGTRLNGVRITSGVEHAVRNGDEIEIGAFKFSVAMGEFDQRYADSGTAETQTVSLDEVVTHLVADVRGFSTVSQKLNSSLIYDVMSELFDELSRQVHANSGTIKDYAGDAIFAFWEHGREADPKYAVLACQAAVKQMEVCGDILKSLPEQYSELRQLQIGWGVATGEVTLSHYGIRNENMAVVGDSTNLAFRLAALANKTLEAPIVVCETTAQLIGLSLPLVSLGYVDTKGRSGKEHVFGIKATP